GLVGVAHHGRPHRSAAVANPAPGQVTRCERAPSLFERGTVAYRIGRRHWNVVAAKQQIKRILVMTQLDRLRGWQERMAWQGLAFVESGKQKGIVVVARYDQIDAGAHDHRTKVPVEVNRGTIPLVRG